MTIKITKKQNVTADGVKYLAKPDRNYSLCAFNSLARICISAPCITVDRADNTSVIFIKKEPKPA